jgi:uncharacterized membrane protein YfcA
MDPGLVRDALTVLAGVGTGVLSALFGVGGAVVSTPVIRALGVGALTAVGTTLPSTLPSAVSGALRYTRVGLVDWRVVSVTVPAGIAASVGGALLVREVPGDGHLLMVFTSLLLGFSAYRMARIPAGPVPAQSIAAAEAASAASAATTPAPETDGRSDPRPAVLVGIGLVAGLLSGLLGVGGGVVMVPAFTELARIPLKTAIATSLACVGFFAVPGTITHALLGGIDWRVAFALGIGVIPGARLGAALAIRATDRGLRLAVAVFLGAVAALYFAGELSALVAG